MTIGDVKITNCQSDVDIDVSIGISQKTNCYAGGLTGWSNANISNCCSIGSCNVNMNKTKIAENFAIGGIAGNIAGSTMDNCFSSTELSGKGDDNNSPKIGGLCGRIENQTLATCTIKHSYSTYGGDCIGTLAYDVTSVTISDVDKGKSDDSLKVFLEKLNKACEDASFKVADGAAVIKNLSEHAKNENEKPENNYNYNVNWILDSDNNAVFVTTRKEKLDFTAYFLYQYFMQMNVQAAVNGESTSIGMMSVKNGVSEISVRTLSLNRILNKEPENIAIAPNFKTNMGIVSFKLDDISKIVAADTGVSIKFGDTVYDIPFENIDAEAIAELLKADTADVVVKITHDSENGTITAAAFANDKEVTLDWFDAAEDAAA